MTDLVAFIEARLAEDEAVAHAAGRYPPGHNDGTTWHAAALQTSWDTRVDQHVARHDSARVLRETAAKRRLLMLRANAAGAVAGAWEGTPQRNRVVDHAYLEAITDVLAEVATAWSDHADYRAEWAP